MFSGTAQVSHQVCQFFIVNSVRLLVRVTMVDRKKAVVCCLLSTSAIMLSETKKRKRKMWSKKWYLKLRCSSAEWIARNEMMPSWCWQVNWENCGIPSELRSSVCERRLTRTVLRPALLPVKTAQFTQFFRQVWRHTVKSPLKIRITEISIFRWGVNEIFVLLGCYVVRVCSYFLTFRDNLSVSSSRSK